jgi:hypothetical protein
MAGRTVKEWIGATCSLDGCTSPVKGHEFCNKHLKRFQKHGDPTITIIDEQTTPRRKRGEPITIDLLFSRSMPEPNSGCWIWLGAIRSNGYGAINIEKKTRSAHRLAYEIANKKSVPSNLDVCHRCDVRACINPDHLFVGTRKDNMVDCANKGRNFVPLLRGEESPNSKLTVRQVLAIRKDSRSIRALGRAYGVDRGTIASIVHRKTWRHI